MFEQRIFETDFKTALSEELDRRGMTVRQLSEATGIPPVTLYKISSGERDPRLSTVKKIVSVFSPHHGKFIALIAAKFLLDEIEGTKVDVGGVEYRIKGYTANSLDDCILAAVHARYEKDTLQTHLMTAFLRRSGHGMMVLRELSVLPSLHP